MFELIDSDVCLSVTHRDEPVEIKIHNRNRCSCGRFRAKGKPCSLEVPARNSWTGWEHL